MAIKSSYLAVYTLITAGRVYASFRQRSSGYRHENPNVIISAAGHQQESANVFCRFSVFFGQHDLLPGTKTG
jgi:hypothetical protein